MSEVRMKYDFYQPKNKNRRLIRFYLFMIKIIYFLNLYLDQYMRNFNQNKSTLN